MNQQMPPIDFHKEIESGWTVDDIINDLDVEIGSIMNGTSFRDPFKTPEELERYIAMNLRCYTDKEIPEIKIYFNWKYKL